MRLTLRSLARILQVRRVSHPSGSDAQETMYLKCAHPECTSDFDYAQGRLIRFHQTPKEDKQPSHWHSVKHYWLCTRCCETYTIEYHKGLGVVLMQRLEALNGIQPSHFVLQPDPEAIRPMPHRRFRHAERKRKGESAPASTITIEILESRNLERRG